MIVVVLVIMLFENLILFLGKLSYNIYYIVSFHHISIRQVIIKFTMKSTENQPIKKVKGRSVNVGVYVMYLTSEGIIQP